jgi:chromate transporter
MKKYLTLFLTMLKIGLFTFGGGYAMIALLENEFVSRKKWIEKDEFLDMVAIAESTPGPIAINSATYLGYKILGVTGSLTATIAVCIPSFFIIYVISIFFDAFLSLTLVSYAFKGIQVCVIYLIFSAGIKLLKGIKKTAFNISIICIVIASMVFTTLFAIKFSTVYYILIAGMVGIFAYFINNLKDRKEADK